MRAPLRPLYAIATYVEEHILRGVGEDRLREKEVVRRDAAASTLKCAGKPEGGVKFSLNAKLGSLRWSRS